MKALASAIVELDDLLNSVNYWLMKARGNNPRIYYIEYLRGDISKSGFHLSYYKTNEEELKKIEQKSHEIAAFYWLDQLRNATLNKSESIKEFRYRLSKLDLPLSHFKTDEKELEELSRKS